ncbi:MAG: T9SS type A sorting domain-containing protein [Flavobacteriales bacterium]|jgi:photosystem II stability/assembly factor-like uncharacterized protein|nr:T9SS type A sorting domain-containing protein [Flavobacteriales bacterium]
MKKVIFPVIALSIIALSYQLLKSDNAKDSQLSEEVVARINKKKKKKKGRIVLDGLAAPSMKHSVLRAEYISKLADPKTGKIPQGIRAKELAFVNNMPISNSVIDFEPRGYFKIGGRTRALAFDVNDENTIIAGGVSGGIFKSTDGGQTWVKKTMGDQFHGVTCIVQDKRPGKTNNWYFGTGEGYGNSASAPSAYYFGNGMYHSDDNGETWNAITSTNSNTPNTFDLSWDVMWNIALDQSVDSLTILYGACHSSIFRSEDGGNTWSATTLASGGNSSAYTTNILVTPSGVTYGVLNSDAPSNKRGIWRSNDHGNTWENILPDSFPGVYERIVMDYNPQNENQVYFFAQTPNFGKHTNTFFDGEDWNSLWLYEYDENDTNSVSGTWTDLSDNLPDEGTSFATLYTQNAYDMAIAVHPDSANVVFIGGTNLYRSTDGFTSDQNTTMIGGYKPTSIDTNWDIYENHHPDQHLIAFSPTSHKFYSANDGGIFTTTDEFASNVVWDDLNNGYFTTQLYAVSVNQKQVTNTIVAGFQDNGNFVTRSANITDKWNMAYNGDGGWSYVTEDEDDIYLSIQRGKVAKFTLDAQGNQVSFRRMEPAGLDPDDGLFIHPFAVDPVSENTMYYPHKHDLYVYNNISSIQETGEKTPLTSGWNKVTGFDIASNKKMVSIHVTKANPGNVVYIGTDERAVFKVENPNSNNPIITELPYKDINNKTAYYSGFTIDIASNPDNGNELIFVNSNYTSRSLFYTSDGGTTVAKIGGNLEENIDGSGNGPSMRSAEILTFSNGEKMYLAGSSVGLFGTAHLNGDSTKWYRVSPEIIGNTIIERIVYRKEDGLLLIATHGNGIYYANVNSVSDLLSNEEVIVDKINTNSPKIKITENPVKGRILKFELLDKNSIDQEVALSFYSEAGHLVKNLKIFLNSSNSVDLSSFKDGVYFMRVQSEDLNESVRFVIY